MPGPYLVLSLHASARTCGWFGDPPLIAGQCLPDRFQDASDVDRADVPTQRQPQAGVVIATAGYAQVLTRWSASITDCATANARLKSPIETDCTGDRGLESRSIEISAATLRKSLTRDANSSCSPVISGDR